MKKLALLVFAYLLLMWCQGLFAQSTTNLTQTVRGEILDVDAKIPLPGVGIEIISVDPPLTAITDVDGHFEIQNVPVGRHIIRISYVGYEERVLPGVEVNSGKETFVSLEIQEEIVQMNEVVIERKKNGETNDENAVVSAREFSVEETKRYPGTFNDPARMASAFAGVASDPSGNNDIIIRGNSPKGVLWRIEGIEVPNPNHFANDGATGGPISILNSNILDNSDFFTSAFPAEYGNAYSGVFDIELRKGNSQEREYSFQLSTLGIDASAEGPINAEKRSSYIANYRYSTLGLLDNLGLVDFDGVPKYQDAALKVNLPTDNAGTFTLFGVGGISNINFSETNEAEDTVFSRGNYNARMGVVGINNLYFISDKTFVRTTLALTAQGFGGDEEELTDDKTDYRREYNEDVINYAIRSKVMVNHKFNSRSRITSGVYFDQLSFDYNLGFFSDERNSYTTALKESGSTALTRAYVNWKYKLSKKLVSTSGLHYTYFHLNESQALEPRLGLEYKYKPHHTFSAGAGLHSKIETLSAYFASNELGEKLNKDLGLTKSAHFVLGYDWYITDYLRFGIETYYQHLFNVPVAADSSAFAIINSSEGFTTDELVNEGTSDNYGVELTLERYFEKGLFYLATLSLFDSKFTDLSGTTRNTTYNGRYVANLMAGKEFDVSNERKIRRLTFSLKGSFAGGRWLAPIDLQESIEAGHTIREDKPFTKQMSDFSKLDVQVKLTTDRAKTTHEVMLEIQNVTNAQNPTYDYYNSNTQEVEEEHQLSILPALYYKISF